MYKLIFEKGSLTGRIYEFSEGRIVVGRDADSRLRLRDDGVSRQHCYFEEKTEGVFVRDMGSTNGVFVNNQKVTEEKLSTGDRVKVGAALVRVEIEGQPAPIPAKDDEKETKTPAGAKPSTPKSSKMTAVTSSSAKLDRTLDRPRSGAIRQQPPAPAPQSGLTMILAAVALLCVLGALVWVTILQNQVRQLSREVSGGAFQPLMDSETQLSKDVDRLKQEVDELKLRLQNAPRVPPPEPPRAPAPPDGSQQTPPANTAPANAGQQAKTLRFESPVVADKSPADDVVDERVEISLKLRFSNAGGKFQPDKARVIVLFYDSANGKDVAASLSVPSKTIAGESSWREGATATVEASYLVPKGGRAKEKEATGAAHAFYGVAARAYYADELVDTVYFPSDFPRELR